MRVVLVTTPARTRKVNYILPSGVLALAGYLEQKGHEVHVVDAALLRKPHGEIAGLIAGLKPQLVGISGIITAYAYIIGLSHEIKRQLPDIPIVLGGQVGVSNEINCFSHMAIDFLVHGYGEFPLEKLTRHLDGALLIEMIPGVSWRRNNQIVSNPGREYFRHLDERPLPAYHLVDMDHYANALRGTKGSDYVFNGRSIPYPRALPVFGTLGCTDRCSFCIHEQEFVGLKVASNPVLIEHLKFLNQTYGINIFVMGEEMFVANFARAKQFNDLMKKHLPNCYWSATTRANFITPELIAELKTGHCLALDWGHESGSQRMLDLMNKRMTVEVNNRAYRLTKESNLFRSTTLMVGNGGETNTTILETIRNIKHIGLSGATVFYAAAYPGGRTWDWAVERGIIPDTHKYLLSVSDQDAARLSINLTPYPNFVLRAWKAMMTHAIEIQARRERPGHPKRLTLSWGVRHFLRSLSRDIWLGFALPLLVWLYCGATMPLRNPRGKNGKYAFETDQAGAIKPGMLKVGKPQGAMTEQDIRDLMSRVAPRIDPLTVE